MNVLNVIRPSLQAVAARDINKLTLRKESHSNFSRKSPILKWLMRRRFELQLLLRISEIMLLILKSSLNLISAMGKSLQISLHAGKPKNSQKWNLPFCSTKQRSRLISLYYYFYSNTFEEETTVPHTHTLSLT
jgi:hypothetical protein